MQPGNAGHVSLSSLHVRHLPTSYRWYSVHALAQKVRHFEWSLSWGTILGIPWASAVWAYTLYHRSVCGLLADLVLANYNSAGRAIISHEY